MVIDITAHYSTYLPLRAWVGLARVPLTILLEIDTALVIFDALVIAVATVVAVTHGTTRDVIFTPRHAAATQ